MLLASAGVDAPLTVDISTETEILTYTHNGTDPILAVARIELGKVQPIMGGGTYHINFYISDSKIIPNFPIVAAAGQTTLMAQSKEVILAPNDVVSLRVSGQPADADVDVIAHLVSTEAGDLQDTIDTAIRASLRDLAVRPERTVLGRCRPSVRQFRSPDGRPSVRQFRRPKQR